MPRFLGKDIGFIDFKYAISPKRKTLLQDLLRLGLASAEPVNVKGKKVAPLDVLLAVLPDPSTLASQADGHTCVVVEVDGRSRAHRRGARYWTILSHADAHRHMGVHATAFLTGTPPAATVQALVNQEIDQRGVITGGGLDPKPILRRIAALGAPLFEGEVGAPRGRPLGV